MARGVNWHLHSDVSGFDTPPQPEESTFKGDEHAIDGQVMDITGRISTALTGPNGEVAITENDGTQTERSKYL